MDLSKAFDTLNHDLLTAKLEAYSFSAKSLSYIHSYVNKRLQKTNVTCDFNLWKEIFSGVPLVYFYSICILMAFSFLSMKHF